MRDVAPPPRECEIDAVAACRKLAAIYTVEDLVNLYAKAQMQKAMAGAEMVVARVVSEFQSRPCENPFRADDHLADTPPAWALMNIPRDKVELVTVVAELLLAAGGVAA